MYQIFIPGFVNKGKKFATTLTAEHGTRSHTSIKVFMNPSPGIIFVEESDARQYAIDNGWQETCIIANMKQGVPQESVEKIPLTEPVCESPQTRRDDF